jgi:uncharacterized membrane protein required for colicin V production
MGITYDVFLLLLIFGGMLTGFSTGLMRQVINLVGLYFGIVFAAFYHPMLVRWATRMLGESQSLGREALLFFLIFVAIWGFVVVGAYYGLRGTPRFLPLTTDRLAGMVLGMGAGVLVAVVVTLLLGYTTEVPWPRDNGIRLFISSSIDASSLSSFLSGLVPTVAGAIEPWVPRGLPSFFHLIPRA